jgi:hypothetical protein
MNTQYDLLETLADFRLTAEIVELSQISLPKELPADLKETLLQTSTKQNRCWQNSPVMRRHTELISPILVCPLAAKSKKNVVIGNLSTYSLIRSYLPSTGNVLVLRTNSLVPPSIQIDLIRVDILYSKCTLGSITDSGFKKVLNKIFQSDETQKVFANPLFHSLFPNITSRKNLSHLFDIANQKIS